ncbi:MAG: hypothetical protein [Podoviridae sp. ctcf755]|nr:MAG: hypothetical protein [Podoviridae sp. ctcf755]
MARNRYLTHTDGRRGRRRNPYGAEGGYVRDHAGSNSNMPMDGRDYHSGYDGRYDYNPNSNRYGQDGHHYNEQFGQYNRPVPPMQYEVYGIGRPSYMSEVDYARQDGKRRDRNSQGNYNGEYYEDYEDGEKEWKKDLEKWSKKLKRNDRFEIPKQEVINRAKEMNVRFDEFSEEEFYVTYLMMISDYKDIANDPNAYIKMAKKFLEDDDIEVSPSEKLCIYYYEIVKGEGVK